jgi:hypothetical protein
MKIPITTPLTINLRGLVPAPEVYDAFRASALLGLLRKHAVFPSRDAFEKFKRHPFVDLSAMDDSEHHIEFSRLGMVPISGKELHDFIDFLKDEGIVNIGRVIYRL